MTPTDSSMKHLHCASEECTAQYPEPLYNVAAKMQQAGAASRPDWRCIRHIPQDMTFPIALHGEDFKAWKNES